MPDFQPDLSSYPSNRGAGGGGGNAFGGVMGPLQALGEFAHTQNEMNQAKLFQQQFQARTALGPIYQSAIDPSTGNFDINKFISGVASNPQTSFMAGEVINQALQRQLTQADVLSKHLDNTQKVYDHWANTAAGLVSAAGPGGTISMDKVLGALSNGVALDYIPRDTALSIIQNLPKDPQSLTEVVKRVAYSNQTASNTLKATMGDISIQNAGGRLQPFQTRPTEGTVTPMGPTQGGNAFRTTLTPEQANVPTSAQTPTGADITGPRAGGPVPTVPGTVEPQSGAPPMPGAAPSPGGGNAPGGASPTVGVPGQPPVTGSNVTTTKNPASVQKFLNREGPEADYENDLNNSATIAKQQLSTFQEEMRLLQQFRAGGGATVRTDLAQTAQAMGASKDTVDRIQGGDLSAAQEFEKLAVVQAMNVLMTAMGNKYRPTGFEFETFNKNLPNLSTDPRAINGMTHFMQIMANQIMMEQQAFAAAKQHGIETGWKDYTPDMFRAKWNAALMRNGMLDLRSKAQQDALKAVGVSP